MNNSHGQIKGYNTKLMEIMSIHEYVWFTVLLCMHSLTYFINVKDKGSSTCSQGKHTIDAVMLDCMYVQYFLNCPHSCWKKPKRSCVSCVLPFDKSFWFDASTKIQRGTTRRWDACNCVLHIIYRNEVYHFIINSFSVPFGDLEHYCSTFLWICRWSIHNS